jgi:hypothetical protein
MARTRVVRKPPVLPALVMNPVDPIIKRRGNKGKTQVDTISIQPNEGTYVPIIYGKVKTGGIIIFAKNVGSQIMVTYLIGWGPINSISDVTFQNGLTTTQVAVTLGTMHLGDTTTNAAVDALHAAYATTEFTSRLPGLAYFVAMIPAGVDPYSMQCVVEGLKIPVHDTDPTLATKYYTENVADVRADFWTNKRYAGGRPTSIVDYDTVDEAHDDCAVVLADGKQRFRIGIKIAERKSFAEWDELLRQHAQMFDSQFNGKYQMFVDKVRAASSIHLIDSGPSAQIVSVAMLDRDKAEIPNKVTFACTDQYVAPATYFKKDSATIQHSGIGLGTIQEVIEQRFDTFGVPSKDQARRLAVWAYNRLQKDKIYEVTTLYNGVYCVPGLVITLTSVDVDAAAAQMLVTGVSESENGLNYIITLEVYDPAIYSDTQIDFPAVTPPLLPSTLDTVPNPTGVTATTEIRTTNGTANGQPVLVVDWTSPANYLYYRTTRLTLTRTKAGDTTRTWIEGEYFEGPAVIPITADGATYDVLLQTVSVTERVSTGVTDTGNSYTIPVPTWVENVNLTYSNVNIDDPQYMYFDAPSGYDEGLIKEYRIMKGDYYDPLEEWTVWAVVPANSRPTATSPLRINGLLDQRWNSLTLGGSGSIAFDIITVAIDGQTSIIPASGIYYGGTVGYPAGRHAGYNILASGSSDRVDDYVPQTESTLTVVAGNNNNVSVPSGIPSLVLTGVSSSSVVITGIAAPTTIAGAVGGGSLLRIYNPVSILTTVYLNNEDALSSAANRIDTMGRGNAHVPIGCSALLEYSSHLSRWRLIHVFGADAPVLAGIDSRIQSLGVGSTIPDSGYLFQIKQTAGNVFAQIKNLLGIGGNVGLEINNNVRNWFIGLKASNSFIIRDETGSSTVVEANTSGEVGIGSSPVSGIRALISGILRATNYLETNDGTRTVRVGGDATGGYFSVFTNNAFRILTNNVARLTISATGNILNYFASVAAGYVSHIHENTNATGFAQMIVRSGDGTGSGNYAFFTSRLNKTSPSEWSWGNYGDSNWILRDVTNSRTVLTASTAGHLDATGNLTTIAYMKAKKFRNTRLDITPAGASPVYNQLAISGTGYVRIVTGATGTITINGILAGEDGDELTIFNNSGIPINFSFNSASATTTNDRIYNAANATVSLPNGGAQSFIYDTANGKWIMIAK